MSIDLQNQTSPIIAIILSTLFFAAWERISPGRDLPPSKNWYVRAILINSCQLILMAAAGVTWNKYFREHSLTQFGNWENPILEGLFYWFIGTFVFYWWHRIRHMNGFWVLFHQIHHSPSRIEVLTSFYKHPIEIASDSIVIGFMVYSLFGGSALAGAWYAFFAATGEYFYHANIKTPHWIGYIMQRPEHHSIHHQLGVHKYNYSDLTLWDRMFGTFKDTEDFVSRCGFPKDNETHLTKMLLFKDVYKD